MSDPRTLYVIGDIDGFGVVLDPGDGTPAYPLAAEHIAKMEECGVLVPVTVDDLLIAAAECIAETQTTYRLMQLVEHVHMRIGHQAVLGGNDEPLPQIPSTA